VAPQTGEQPTAELIGGAAVHRLLQMAAGLMTNSEPFDAAATIHASASLSSAAGSLGSRLAPLFWAATTVCHRVRLETDFDSAHPVRSENERMAAERIVEEEFISYRSQQAAATGVPRSGRSWQARKFEQDERESTVRIRVAEAYVPPANENSA
jgi:hypothetical protein